MTDIKTLVDGVLGAKTNVLTPGDEAKVIEHSRVKAALNEEAIKRWDDAGWHKEIAALISTRFDYGFRFDLALGDWLDTRRVGYNDSVVIEERRGLKSFWTARGAYIEESGIRTNRWTMGRDTIGFHIVEFEDKLKVNFAESLATMISLGQTRMDADINKRVLATFQTVIGVSSPYYIAATGGLTKPLIDDAITEVADQAVADNDTEAGVVTILGRRTAIDKISDLATAGNSLFDPEGTAEVRRKGRLGVYRGANLQVLKNYQDENGVSLIDPNELWVMSKSAGTLAYYGSPVTKSYTENDYDYQHYRTRQDVGVAVFFPQRARRIVISDESS